MKTQLLKLSEIVTTAGTQIRARLDTDTVDEYATAMLDAANKFPAVVVFHDGSQFVLADGFHRVMAAARNGFKDISAEIHKGAKSDALKFALSANSSHGLKRSPADKRRSVSLALSEWPKLSDRELAKICAVGYSLVADVRRDEQLPETGSSATQTRIGADGKERKLPAKKKLASVPADAHALTDTRTEAQKTEAVFTDLAKSIKEEESDRPVTLKDLQIAFEDNIQPIWIKADAKTKKAFIAWLKA